MSSVFKSPTQVDRQPDDLILANNRGLGFFLSDRLRLWHAGAGMVTVNSQNSGDGTIRNFADDLRSSAQSTIHIGQEEF
jgi:hypothetical protein